ncbi:unnamed protein product (macronuclear) [Paramecium tetraurelia]|uniref:Fibronectin type-III domain-containing protein n=1 Tax=Paramecium tetraurelia TaxID=5888 RepID=A0BZ08_PARTE|nr:uncharacterized protein GSPATT00033628001 [Paramecium tetraurelia]CAK63775.1 unnamed protein product [Paramecium tetraurelia]|eukprot:XP_001431173.1 hypothetical protein (macronuclear) [Paramecium tetraurelia strain d4-2]
MKEHQGQLGVEFQPIKQKYFLHEKEHSRQDPFVESLQEYFQIFRRRIILHILLCTLKTQQLIAFFFLALMIPSIVLQADYIELDVSQKGGIFTMEQTWDPPISVQMFSKTDILLLDVQLSLDGEEIEEFTIYERLYINTQYNLTSNTNYSFTVRLMAQFDFVPTCNASHLAFVLYPYIHSLQKTLIFYCVQFSAFVSCESQLILLHQFISPNLLIDRYQKDHLDLLIDSQNPCHKLKVQIRNCLNMWFT